MTSADAAGRSVLVQEQTAVLTQVVATAEATEKPFWMKQLAETLAAAVQDGTLPEGIAKLEQLADSVSEQKPRKQPTAFNDMDWFTGVIHL